MFFACSGQYSLYVLLHIDQWNRGRQVTAVAVLYIYSWRGCSMWCQGASYLCGNTLFYSTHYPVTPMQFLPMRVYILLSFVFNNRGFVHRRNIMKQVENKAKTLLIMIENLANKSCSGILNVKTKTFGQTSRETKSFAV